jgi:ribosomal-protein-alanine N-acetyltransferase
LQGNRRKQQVRGTNADVSERVVLRLPTARDRRELLALRRANRRFLERWEPRGPRGRPNFGPSAIDRFLKQARTDANRKFLVCLREDGSIIGQVSLNNIVRGALQSCAMGYWIGKKHSRQGLMTEAVDLALRHAFAKLKLHRVEANLMPVNNASRALAKKCGLRFEGVSMAFIQINGRWEDHERWAITVDEWRTNPNPPGRSARAPIRAGRRRARRR